MAGNQIRCPHCMLEATAEMFQTVDAATLRCRRCRNRFEDPDVYEAGVSYADCDSKKAVFRFPFSMNGSSAAVRVRSGYAALLAGNNGQRRWLQAGEHRITDMPEGFQLYYVCLRPRIRWGTRNAGGFGAYGMAELSLNADYPENFCRSHDHILALEDHLRSLAEERVTYYVRWKTEEHSTGILEQRDGYMSVLGKLEEGAAITGISPFGYRDANGGTGLFHSFADAGDHGEKGETGPVFRIPVSERKPSEELGQIRDGIEEVLIRGASRAERHKAGELITPETLKGVGRIFRFSAREFEFPWGWGIANQPCPGYGFFSAHGTMSFYIDSTEKMSLVMSRTEGWDDFEEQLFLNVIRQEMADRIGRMLKEYFGNEGADPGRIRNHLSAMSVALTGLLNGGDSEKEEPAFSRFGLRVKRTDIMDITLYSSRK